MKLPQRQRRIIAPPPLRDEAGPTPSDTSPCRFWRGGHSYVEFGRCFHRHLECEKCGHRRVVMGRGGMAPVNRRWLAGGAWGERPVPGPAPADRR